MDATVHALFIKPRKKSSAIPMDAVQVVATGSDGDSHVTSKSRQVLLISRQVLTEFDLQPGALSENIIIEGLDVMSLAAGQTLRIGTAVLEITTPCEPCIQMERIRSGLRSALKDRRGIFAKVTVPGGIRVGDAVVPV